MVNDPTKAHLAYLDADGWELESDFYLVMASEIVKRLRGEADFTPTQPVFGKLECDGNNWKQVASDQCKPSCGAIGGSEAHCMSTQCGNDFFFDTYDCNYCCMAL